MRVVSYVTNLMNNISKKIRGEKTYVHTDLTKVYDVESVLEDKIKVKFDNEAFAKYDVSLIGVTSIRIVPETVDKQLVFFIILSFAVICHTLIHAPYILPLGSE